MKSATQKRKIISKKQTEFVNFVEEKVFPMLANRGYDFDMINPPLWSDEWTGKEILITIPYGERMEPYLARCVSEAFAYNDKTIVVIMGAKINTNAWHKLVFPFAEEIAFIRRGKRPTAFVVYKNGLENRAFTNDEDENIFTSAAFVENTYDWVKGVQIEDN